MSASSLSMLIGGHGKEQVGQLKLPLLPKDESQFFLWKMKVQSTIEGIGAAGEWVSESGGKLCV